MESSWSPVVATGGNQRQITQGGNRQIKPNPFASGCDQLPETGPGLSRRVCVSRSVGRRERETLLRGRRPPGRTTGGKSAAPSVIVLREADEKQPDENDTSPQRERVVRNESPRHRNDSTASTNDS